MICDPARANGQMHDSLFHDVWGDRDRTTCCAKRRKVVYESYDSNKISPFCEECYTERNYVRHLRKVGHELDSRAYTMGQAEVAMSRLKQMAAVPDVYTDENWCENCKDWHSDWPKGSFS